MKNVGLNSVRGFEKITSVSVDLSSLPKVGLSGKNNRIHTCTTVNNGTHYCLPTYVELVANGENFCCELKPRLTQMIKIDNSNYRCVIKDEVLGSFVVRFDDLLRTKTFANKIKDEIIRHLKNIEELAKQIDKANQLASESCKRATEYNEKYTTECMAHESTRYALTVSQTKVMQLEEKIDEMNKQAHTMDSAIKTKVSDIPFIVKTVVRMYERGTSVDTIINKITKKLQNRD